jgi:methyl-accepting chemotaxis protein
MNNLSVTKKLQIGIAALVILSSISSMLNYLAYQKVASAYKEFVKLNDASRELNIFTNLLTNNTLGYMDAIVDKESGTVDKTITDKHMGFSEWTKKNQDILIAHMKYINPSSDVSSFSKKIQSYWSAGDSMIIDINNKKIDTLTKYDDDIDGLNESLQEDTAKTLSLSDESFKKASLKVETAQNMISNSSIISLVSVLLCGVLISIYVIRSINQTLDSAGKKLLEGTETVLKSSIEFADLGILIKDSTTKQASSLQESVSAIDEIKATVDRNADLSNESVDIANNCVESSQKGKSAVQDMVKAVGEIESTQNKTYKMLEMATEEMKEMVNVIRGIEQKTAVINDIVFQTKLLSFNASVEAARAGENGKGFAVVAEEVGKLATMSGTAAKEINELLQESIQKVGNIVDNTQRSAQEINRSGHLSIETGARTAKNCDDALAEIFGHVAMMKDKIKEINASSSEQVQGIGSISLALNELDHITNENVISAEKCAFSANKLSAQSKNLEMSVDDLFVTIKGQN